jgi:nicotinamide-nucleotide amidase
MPLSNLKQASLIPSARAIPNPYGTAPGWFVAKDGRVLIAMPGPPGELQPMWRERVLPELCHISGSIILTRTYKTSGLSEGAVGELVAPLFSSTNPIVGVYAKPDGIQLRLAAKGRDREAAEKILAESEVSIKAALREYIWGTDDDTPGVVVGRLLATKGLTLAVMEDHGGGSLTASITDIPDSRAFFKGGLIACSDDAKVAFGVDAGLISRYGSLSPEVVRAMAEAARSFLNADIGLSTMAAAETKERPTGVFCIGIADGNGSLAINRPGRKQHLASAALFELRKRLISSGSGKPDG